MTKQIQDLDLPVQTSTHRRCGPKQHPLMQPGAQSAAHCLRQQPVLQHRRLRCLPHVGHCTHVNKCAALKHCCKVATDVVLSIMDQGTAPKCVKTRWLCNAHCRSRAVPPLTSCGLAARQDGEALCSGKPQHNPPGCTLHPTRSKPFSKERYPFASCRACARRDRHKAALLCPLPPAALPG